jgi:hypothetical protein
MKLEFKQITHEMIGKFKRKLVEEQNDAYDGASDHQKRSTSDHFSKGIFCKVIVA